MPFDTDAARAAGYTDGEISEYLQKSGRSPEEVTTFLKGTTASPFGMTTALSGRLATAKPGPYKTNLQPLDEMRFQDWVKAGKIPFDNSETSDYDMRGFYQATQSGGPNASTSRSPFDGLMHFPDRWKTPYHKSFSAESQYAQPAAPAWDGNRLINKTGGVVSDERPPQEKARDSFLSDMRAYKTPQQ